MKDKFLWLEEINEAKAIDWVTEENHITENHLTSTKYYDSLFAEAKECLSDKDKVEWIHLVGDMVYNIWKDEENQLGLFRRMPLERYLAKEKNWEPVFSVDDYAKETGVQWSFSLPCFNDDYTKALFSLSDGGKDANFIKEFDLVKKEFITDGLSLPESKGDATYFNDDEIICSRDFGKDTLTISGYPRISKLLKRGEDLLEGKVILEAKGEDTFQWTRSFEINHKKYILGEIAHDFYNCTMYIYADGNLIDLKNPKMADVSSLLESQSLLILKIKEDFLDFKQGSLISLNVDDVIKRGEVLSSDWKLVFEPKENEAFENCRLTKNSLIVHLMEDIKSRAYIFKLDNGTWTKEKLNLPDFGKITHITCDHQRDEEDFFIYFESFNRPTTTYYGTANSSELKEIKSASSLFDHENIIVSQEFTVSKDGTKVPYFLIHHKDIELNGNNKTIIYGYGGFEISLSPYFSNVLGKLWVDKNNVYVMTNIRGGGEYGPAWHQAALKFNRNKAYEDFFSVAEDLFAKKITNPDKLTAQGGSNGGLLMGACFTQRPDLFKGICCQVPLLDMLRFHKLLAGASWIAEYGDPDIEEERKHLASYSPYHNVKEDQKYPRMFITTSTKDDRVHPGHARKMAALLKDIGHDYFYLENFDGGHGSNVSIDKLAKEVAIRFSYFHSELD